MGRAVNDLYVECGCQKINCTASLIVSESSGYDHVSFLKWAVLSGLTGYDL